MSTFLVNLAISQIVKWVSGLTKADFAQIVEFVQEAEKSFIASAEKAAWVKKALAETFPKVTGFAVNLLLELAVAKVRRSG